MSAHPMRQAVVRGGVVMAASTVAMRASSFLSQLVLGRLLLPEDFGVYAIALSFVAVASSLRSVLRPYLVDVLRTEGDWGGFYRLTMWSVLASTGLAVAAAPFLARGFRVDQLGPLLILMFLSIPVQVYPVFGLAVLNNDLRFDRLGRALTIAIVIRHAVTVVGALLGLGALSFAVGVWAGSVYECLAVRLAAGVNPSLFGRMNLSVLRTGGRALRWLPIGVVALTLWVNGDYAVAGLFQSTVVVGLYYFAYQLTTALAQPFTTAAQSVLVPSFGRLHQSDRLQESFLESIELVILLSGLPLGVLAVLASPLVHLVWDGRWDEASVAVIALASVLPVKLSHSVALSIAQARGNWRQYATLVSVSALSTILAAAIGASLGGLREFVTVMAIAHVGTGLGVAAAIGRSLGVPVTRTVVRALLPWMMWAMAIGLVALSTPLESTDLASIPLRLCVFVLASVPIIFTMFSDSLFRLVAVGRGGSAEG